MQSEQRDGRSLDVRPQRNAVNNAVSRVPASAHAHAVEKHFDSKPNSFFRFRRAVANCELLDRDHAESSWNYPATGSRAPGPSIFVRIEADVAIRCFEFPAPEPVPLFT